jgi:hypothetical protein
MKVTFYGIRDGTPAAIGEVRWDGSAMSASDNLSSVLEEPIVDPEAMKKIRARDDPESFMRNLHTNYTGAYLCAGKVEDDASSGSEEKSVAPMSSVAQGTGGALVGFQERKSQPTANRGGWRDFLARRNKIRLDQETAQQNVAFAEQEEGISRKAFDESKVNRVPEGGGEGKYKPGEFAPKGETGSEGKKEEGVNEKPDDTESDSILDPEATEDDLQEAKAYWHMLEDTSIAPKSYTFVGDNEISKLLLDPKTPQPVGLDGPFKAVSKTGDELYRLVEAEVVDSKDNVDGLMRAMIDTVGSDNAAILDSAYEKTVNAIDKAFDRAQTARDNFHESLDSWYEAREGGGDGEREWAKVRNEYLGLCDSRNAVERATRETPERLVNRSRRLIVQASRQMKKSRSGDSQKSLLDNDELTRKDMADRTGRLHGQGGKFAPKPPEAKEDKRKKHHGLEARRKKKFIHDEKLGRRDEGKGGRRQTRPPAAPEHAFATTQFNLHGVVADRLEQLALEIPEDALAEDGREDEFHVTCLYGITTSDPEPIRRLVEKMAAVQMAFGGIEVFEGAESGKNYDVVYVAVQSAEVVAMHDMLAAEVGNTRPGTTRRSWLDELTVRYNEDQPRGDERNAGHFGHSAHPRAAEREERQEEGRTETAGEKRPKKAPPKASVVSATQPQEKPVEATKEASTTSFQPTKDIRIQHGQDKNLERLRGLLGTKISLEQLGNIACAPDGATIKINPEWSGKEEFTTQYITNGMTALRTISKDKNGALVCSNDLFEIPKELQGKGLGTTLFARQVQQLQELGVSKIVTKASADPLARFKANGYYTWPSLGYDGKIDTKKMEEMPSDLRKAMGKSKSILDLYAIPGGKDWWKEHGQTIKLTFDLSPGSRSVRTLGDYLEKKGGSGGATKPGKTEGTEQAESPTGGTRRGIRWPGDASAGRGEEAASLGSDRRPHGRDRASGGTSGGGHVKTASTTANRGDWRAILAGITRKSGMDAEGEAMPEQHTFIPHATLAYVKAGRGKEFIKPSGLEEIKITVDTLTFCDQHGEETPIRLQPTVGQEEKSVIAEGEQMPITRRDDTGGGGGMGTADDEMALDTEGGGESEGKQQKPGSRWMHALHEYVTGGQELLKEMRSECEHPDVLAHADATHDALTSMKSETAAVHNKTYPEEPALEDDATDTDAEIESGNRGGKDEPSGEKTEVQSKPVKDDVDKDKTDKSITVRAHSRGFPMAGEKTGTTRKSALEEAEERTAARKMSAYIKEMEEALGLPPSGL